MTAAKQEPLLMRGGLSSRVFVVTRYKPTPTGGLEAVEKHDVTDQFYALIAEGPAMEVWWCLQHSDRAWDTRHEFCVLAPGLDNSEGPCRMVPARLVLPASYGETP